MLRFKGYGDYVFSFLHLTSGPRTLKQRGEGREKRKGKKETKSKDSGQALTEPLKLLSPKKNPLWIKFNEMMLIIAMACWVFTIYQVHYTTPLMRNLLEYRACTIQLCLLLSALHKGTSSQFQRAYILEHIRKCRGGGEGQASQSIGKPWLWEEGATILRNYSPFFPLAGFLPSWIIVQFP